MADRNVTSHHTFISIMQKFDVGRLMGNILGLIHKHVVLRERFKILTKTSAVT